MYSAAGDIMKTREEVQYILINQTESIEAGLKKLDNSAGLPLLVVDENNALKGTISDGDIRRALLHGVHLEDSIAAAMCTRPIIANISSSLEDRLFILRSRQLRVLPVTDDHGCLCGAEILSTHASARPNEAVLMCGGLGTRLGSLTRDCPKPMLEVGGKPILERIMCNLIKGGISRFFFATNYLREKIEDYFGDGQKWGVNIQYLRETKRMGTGGALSLLPYIPAHPFLVMNGDILTTFNATHLLDFHEMCRSIATLGIVRHCYQNPYGVIRHEGSTLVGIDEKPIESCFINAGIYVVEPRLLETVPHNVFIDMPTLLLQAKDRGEFVSVCPICESWIDIGREADYKAAQQLI